MHNTLSHKTNILNNNYKGNNIAITFVKRSLNHQMTNKELKSSFTSKLLIPPVELFDITALTTMWGIYANDFTIYFFHNIITLLNFTNRWLMCFQGWRFTNYIALRCCWLTALFMLVVDLLRKADTIDRPARILNQSKWCWQS